jgi:hypothetical protein
VSLAQVTNGSNPHAGTVRQSAGSYAKVLLWYSFGPQNYEQSMIGRAGPKLVPHHSAHGDRDGSVPPRLLARPDIGWLFERQRVAALQPDDVGRQVTGPRVACPGAGRG